MINNIVDVAQALQVQMHLVMHIMGFVNEVNSKL